MDDTGTCGIGLVCEENGDVHLKIAHMNGALIVGVRMTVEQAMDFGDRFGDVLAQSIAMHEKAAGGGGTEH